MPCSTYIGLGSWVGETYGHHHHLSALSSPSPCAPQVTAAGSQASSGDSVVLSDTILPGIFEKVLWCQHFIHLGCSWWLP